MDDDVPDATIKVLRKIQVELADMRADMRTTNSMVAALDEKLTTKFSIFEASFTDMSARIFFAATLFQDRTTQHERALAELRARIDQLENS